MITGKDGRESVKVPFASAVLGCRHSELSIKGLPGNLFAQFCFDSSLFSQVYAAAEAQVLPFIPDSVYPPFHKPRWLAVYRLSLCLCSVQSWYLIVQAIAWRENYQLASELLSQPFNGFGLVQASQQTGVCRSLLKRLSVLRPYNGKSQPVLWD